MFLKQILLTLEKNSCRQVIRLCDVRMGKWAREKDKVRKEEKEKERGKEKNTIYSFFKRKKDWTPILFNCDYILSSKAETADLQGTQSKYAVIFFFFSIEEVSRDYRYHFPMESVLFTLISSQTLALQEFTVLYLFWTKETTYSYKACFIKLALFFMLVFCKRLIDGRLSLSLYIYIAMDTSWCFQRK